MSNRYQTLQPSKLEDAMTLALLCAVILFAIWLADFLDYINAKDLMAYILIGGLIGFLSFFGMDPEPFAYHIKHNRLRIGPEASYPIESMYLIKVKHSKNGAMELTIRAKNMDKLKTHPIIDAVGLINELLVLNPSIEVQRD